MLFPLKKYKEKRLFTYLLWTLFSRFSFALDTLVSFQNWMILQVSPGVECKFAQDAVAINTEEKHCCVLGELGKRIVVTPDIDSLLNSVIDLHWFQHKCRGNQTILMHPERMFIAIDIVGYINTYIWRNVLNVNQFDLQCDRCNQCVKVFM